MDHTKELHGMSEAVELPTILCISWNLENKSQCSQHVCLCAHPEMQVFHRVTSPNSFIPELGESGNWAGTGLNSAQRQLLA